MMKKFLFFISCFFMMINTTWAMTLICPEKASPGESLDIRVDAEGITGIKANFNFEEGFTYQDMNLNFPWKSYYDGVNGFSVGNVINQDKLIMDINLKVEMNVPINTDYTLSINDIMASTNDYQTNILEDVSCNIKVLSNVDTLDSLDVEGVTLKPKFDKNVMEYTAETREEKINIVAKATDEGAVVEGDLGEQILEYGVNTFIVKVTSPRGTVREYKIYISRIKSNDATLKSLILSEGEFDFKSDKYLYKVDVDSNVEVIDVEAVANDYMATIKVDKPDKLSFGENEIKVIVTAEDGSVITYMIVVYRPSNDATIKNLTIKNYNIDFKSDIYKYNLRINGEDSLDIKVDLNDSKSKYKIIGNEKLILGGTIKIQVVAEDGTELVYEIVIYNPSNDATIKNLTIKNYPINFKSDVYNYELKINDETSIDIDVVLNDEKAKYEIIGNSNLKNNSVIEIKVTAESGKVSVYKITIIKEEKKNEDVKLSGDATIKNLTIKNYPINFKSNIYEYDLEIKNELKLDIEVVLNDKKAKYEILDNNNLLSGSIVRIEVTAEDGTKSIYKINITKVDLSSDATIRDLIIKEYSIKFKSDVYEYDLEINNEKKLDIKVILNNENAKYEIYGNNNLKNNSVINIEVVAEDNSSVTYKINIIKLGESNSNSVINYIKVVPLICLILLVIGVLIVKKIKNNYINK